MRIKIIPIIALILTTSPALAENSSFPVKIKGLKRQQISEIRNIVDYIKYYDPKTGYAKVYVDDDGFAMLKLLGFSPVRLVDTTRQKLSYILSHARELLYYDYDEITERVHALADSFPHIVALDSIGPTVQWRWIWVLRITDNPDSAEIEPEFIYISTMHGDEIIGAHFLLWLCDSLTKLYRTNSRITRLVDSVDIWVIPVMNPDGYVIGRRRNANRVDLNRNFPVPDGSIGFDGTYLIEPETRAMMEFLSSRRASMTIDFHTGALVVNYPWDFDTARAPDDSLLKVRALDYSKLNPTMFYHSHPPRPGGITNGFDWYEADGTMEDWDYHTGNNPHLIVELSVSDAPPETTLLRIWDDNYNAMLHQIELALTGLHGVVLDSQTNEPLDAQIWIDQIGRWIRTDPEVGDFHRELLAGSYSITVVANGYYPKHITGIIIPTDTSSVYLSVKLTKADTIYFSDFELDDGGLSVDTFAHNQDWAWGRVTYFPYGPDTIFWGSKLWATNPWGNYRDTSQSRLKLGVNLRGVSKAALVYDEWYRFYPINWHSLPIFAHDGGNIKIIYKNDTTLVSPPWGYNFITSHYNWFIPAESVFSDDETGSPWHKTVVFLDSFCGDSITILFDFGSSNWGNNLGWYIDNIAILSPCSLYNIYESYLSPKQTEFKAYPNPFNSHISFIINQIHCEPCRLNIYDVSGKLVYTCLVKSTNEKIIWHPGNNISSGLYTAILTNSASKYIAKILYIK